MMAARKEYLSKLEEPIEGSHITRQEFAIMGAMSMSSEIRTRIKMVDKNAEDIVKSAKDKNLDISKLSPDDFVEKLPHISKVIAGVSSLLFELLPLVKLLQDALDSAVFNPTLSKMISRCVPSVQKSVDMELPGLVDLLDKTDAKTTSLDTLFNQLKKDLEEPGPEKNG